jgi:hypothetical protein
MFENIFFLKMFSKERAQVTDLSIKCIDKEAHSVLGIHKGQVDVLIFYAHCSDREVQGKYFV